MIKSVLKSQVVGAVITSTCLLNACSNITAEQIDEFEAQAGEMQAGEMQAGEMQAGEMQAGAMQAGEMQAGAMQAGEMQAGEMQAGEMQAGEMQAGEMQAGEMQAGEIQAGEMMIEEPTWCKLTRSEVMTFSGGMPATSLTTCTWDDLTQTCEIMGYSNTVTEHNEQGYPLTITSTANNNTTVTTMSYDCSLGWCKLLSNNQEGNETTCTWDNLTQVCTPQQGLVTTSVYNDQGKVLSISMSNDTFSSLSEYTYDCSGNWCKPLTTTVHSTVNGNTTIAETTCEWVDLVQTCRTNDPNYLNVSEYNDVGYLLSSRVTNTGYQTNTTMTYECP